ncbi:flagellar biosynthesis protein FlhF [Halobacillus andaensis]|uniref:flagellar biosynthesis protein FlhF n=1 Tax=Halobacillus andaensis TaxID=1176239 RepID=UPI003D72FD5A
MPVSGSSSSDSLRGSARAGLANDHKEVIKEIEQLKIMIQEQSGTKEPTSVVKVISSYLENQGLDQELVKSIVSEIKAGLNDNEHQAGQVNELVRKTLVRYLTSTNIGHHGFRGKFVQFVGPTGVGKTTTIAKLASEAVLNRKQRVALITTDTYRIAAVEQLKTYAKLLDVPLEVAYTRDDYRRARSLFSNYDRVFVDTAGRNFKNASYVNELTETIDFNEDTETYLVLSLTSKNEDMKRIYDSFNQVPIRQLILTKNDETYSLGGALNLAVLQNIGIAYITNGQGVPDDIESASIFQLVESVMKDFPNE